MGDHSSVGQWTCCSYKYSVKIPEAEKQGIHFMLLGPKSCLQWDAFLFVVQPGEPAGVGDAGPAGGPPVCPQPRP